MLMAQKGINEWLPNWKKRVGEHQEESQLKMKTFGGLRHIARKSMTSSGTGSKAIVGILKMKLVDQPMILAVMKPVINLDKGGAEQMILQIREQRDLRCQISIALKLVPLKLSKSYKADGSSLSLL